VISIQNPRWKSLIARRSGFFEFIPPGIEIEILFDEILKVNA